LVACLNLLAAPGVPISIPLKTKAGGVLVVSAQSYSIDLQKGTARVVRPKVADLQGGTLASIDYLEATGLDALRGADQVVRVRGANLAARIVRLPTGRFEFEQYLPEPKAQPGTTPYEVQIDGIRVRFVDLLRNQKWEQAAVLPNVRVAGLGDDWLASGTATLPKVGRVEAKLQSVAGLGLQINANTPGLQLAEVLRHFIRVQPPKASVEVRKLDVGSLNVFGPVRVFIPKGKVASKSPTAETKLQLEARDVRYGDYTLRRGSFQGLITGRGAAGTIRLQDEDVSLVFEGSGLFVAPRRAAGNLVASVPSPASLPTWARKLIPDGAGFRDAAFNGWINYAVSGGPAPGGVEVSGTATASVATYQGETLRGLNVGLRGDEERLLVSLREGVYRDRPITAVATVDTKRRTIVGAGETLNADLAVVGRTLGLRGLQGRGRLSASVAGSLSDPNIAFYATGNAKYTPPDFKTLDLGKFEAAGTFAGGRVVLSRGIFQSGLGLLRVKGTVDPNGPVALDVVGRAFPVSSFDPRFGGSANVTATVTGTAKNPRATGRVETYGFAYDGKTVPSISTNFALDKERATFQDLYALRGTTAATGSGSFRYRTGAISGNLQAQRLQLADILGPEVVGTVDVSSLTVGGTLRSPAIAGSVSGTNLVAQGVKIDSFQANVTNNGPALRLNRATAAVAGGKISASGRFDTRTRSGQVAVRADNLKLDQLAPGLVETVTLDGTGSGSATARIANGKVASLNGNGSFSDIVLNGTPIGSGNWAATSTGNVVTANLEVGHLDRYIALSNVTLNLADRTVNGRLEASRLKIEDLAQFSLRYLPNLSYDARQALTSVSGVVNVGSTFSGPLREPNVDVQVLEGLDLRYRGQEIGTLNASIEQRNDVWNVRNFSLLGRPGNLTASGTIDEHGAINLSGDLTGLDLQQVGRLEPRLAGRSGRVDLAFSSQGRSASPEIQASLNATGLLARPGEPADRSMRVSLDNIRVSETGGIDIGGNYFYRGFQGALAATVPFRYPFTIPQDGTARASVTLAERPLQEVAQFLDGIDETRTEGTVGGRLTAQGPINNLDLSGQVRVTAPSLGVTGVTDTLRDVTATLSLGDRAINVEGNATSSRGGTVTANASTPLRDLERLAETLQNGAVRELMDNPITGFATVTDLRMRQEFPGRAYVDGSFTGQIRLGGTLASPLISGDVAVANLDSVVPTFEARTAGGGVPLIDPRFNVNGRLSTPAHMRSSAADLFLLGGGAIQGSLSQPRVGADLTVDRGTIRLPGSRVRIEPGGTLELDYRVTPSETIASLEVDLEGRTNVTSAGPGGQNIERYDVNLLVRGDLLREGGLNLTATSDPPGLSQEQILNLLGQTELLSGILGGGRRAESQIRNALAGYALPVVFDPITSGIAQAFGLEYLNLEYNAFGQTSIAFAKVFTRELSLQGSRELSSPLPGFRSRYDLRLVYRPRRFKGLLSRFSVSVGTDEERPFKIALEYGVRF
jgi:hypothetical protein